MTSRDFCFWLQGHFELQDAASGTFTQSLTSAQTHTIKQHLALVFKHEIDPAMGDEKHQEELNKIHDKPSKPADTYKYPGFPGKDENGIQMRC